MGEPRRGAAVEGAMDTFGRELRVAIRSAARSPWTTGAIVLSLGLAIGANTTVFAWMDNIMRHPFPAIPDSVALVAINSADPTGAVEGMPAIAQPALETWRSKSQSFLGIAAHSAVRLNMREAAAVASEPVWSEIVGVSFFDLLGVRAESGRVFSDTDESDTAPVAVIGHDYWQRRFGGDPAVVGRTLLFNSQPLTVIGILPRGFSGVVVGLRFDVWVPLWLQPRLMDTDWSRDRSTRRLQAIARLRPGTTLAQANAELLAVAVAESRDAGDNPISGAAARRVIDTQLGSLIGPLTPVLMVIAGVVLLAACANIAGLQLARASAIAGPSAVRVALGASRSQLLRESLLQSGVIMCLGCAAGLLLAFVSKGALTAFVPRTALPVDLPIAMNWRIITYSLAMTIVAGVLSSAAPAWRVANADVILTIRASGNTRSSSRSRRALVVAQLAFAVMALATTGTLIRSMRAATQVPLGFGDPNDIVLVSTDLSFTGLRGEALGALTRQWLTRIRALPGVRNAALASFVPLSFGPVPMSGATVEGYDALRGERVAAGRIVVSDGYFTTMSIPIVDGRAIDDRDRSSSPRVAVVNLAFNNRFWPGRSAVGRRIDLGAGWATVVGVADNARIDSLNGAIKPVAYLALEQTSQPTLTLHVAAPSGAATLLKPLQQVTTATHQELPLLDPGTLAEHIAAATFVPSVGSRVLSVMGAIAAFMAATGLYGLLSAFVLERTREIAVRVAMGANPRAVVRTVVRPAMSMLSAGLLIGFAGAIFISMPLRNQLVGVSAVDALSLIGAGLLIASVTAVTCIAPATRALGVDPFGVLRAQ